jgi:hypothetical protein
MCDLLHYCVAVRGLQQLKLYQPSAGQRNVAAVAWYMQRDTDFRRMARKCHGHLRVLLEM